MEWGDLRHLHQAMIMSMTLGIASPVSAHDWYPRECCNENDCLPAESFTGSEVTAIGMDGNRYTMPVPKAFPLGRSPDERVHVCFHQPGRDVHSDLPPPAGPPTVPILICLFVPPAS